MDQDPPPDRTAADRGPSISSSASHDSVSIAAIRPRGARGRTFSVELSSGQRLELSAETVSTFGLGVGDAVDTAAVLSWQRDDSERRALEVGLNYVSYRLRSTQEVNEHLRRKSLPASAIDHAIRRLRELGYLDDAAFARFWVQSRNTHRPRGTRALAWELRQKGVPDAIVEDTLEQFAADETPLALAAARKRAGTLKADDPARFRRQLGAFLARRGFSYDVVEQVVGAIWEEVQAEE